MLNRNRLFSNDAAKYMTISHSDFLSAVKNGNSDAIDSMLEAKSNGCKLDIEDEDSSENALEILLRRRDFVNAKKLLQAGADTVARHRVWVDDDGPYPYGGFETNRRDFFKEFEHDKDIIDFLKKEKPVKYAENKTGSSYKQTKKAYEEAMKNLEEAKKNLAAREEDVKLFESSSSESEEVRQSISFRQ